MYKLNLEVLAVEDLDYRALCLELFGTTDEAELRKIAQKTQHNSRNAGRKKKLDDVQTESISEMLSQGKSISEIAETLHVSRTTVSKLVNGKPAPGYTMRIDYMIGGRICTQIDVNFQDRCIRIQNRTDILMLRAFGAVENPTWDDFMLLLSDRCPDPEDENIKNILKDLGIDSFAPPQIVERHTGRDLVTFRFSYYPQTEE